MITNSSTCIFLGVLAIWMLCALGAIAQTIGYVRFNPQLTSYPQFLNISNRRVSIILVPVTQGLDQGIIANQSPADLSDLHFNQTYGLMVSITQQSQVKHMAQILMNFPSNSNITSAKLTDNKTGQVSTLKVQFQNLVQNSYDNYWLLFASGENITLLLVQVLKYQEIRASLYYSPYEQGLYIVTNLLKNGISLVPETNVQLSYNNSADLRCKYSKDSDTNPSWWLHYGANMNFQSLISKQYATIPKNIPTQIIDYMPTSSFVALVQNVYIDCAIIPHVNLIVKFSTGNGPTFLSITSFQLLSFFPTPFSAKSTPPPTQNILPIPLTQPVVAYLEIYQDFYLKIKTEYDILDQKMLLIPVDPPSYSYSFNIYINITEFSKTGNYLKVDNTICNSFYIEMKAICLYNKSVPIIITQTSVVKLFFQPYYIRDFNSGILYNITFSSNNNTVDFFMRNSTIINLTYYQKFHRIHVNTTIKLRNEWHRNFTQQTFVVQVNGLYIVNVLFVPCFGEVFQFDLDTSQIQARFNRTLNSGDNFQVWFDQDYVWDHFYTPQLYHHRWDITYMNNTIIQSPPPQPPQPSQPMPDVLPTSTTPATKVSINVPIQARTTLQIGSYTESGIGLFMFRYVISNLIAFQNLAFLYFFIPFKCSLNVNREKATNAKESLSMDSSLDIFQTFSNISFYPKVLPDQLPAPLLPPLTKQSTQLDFLTHGYSMDFLDNNLDGFFIIALFAIKMSIFKFLSWLISWDPIRIRINRILFSWREMLYTQVLMMGPGVYVAIGLTFRVGVCFWNSGWKINFVGNVLMVFIVYYAFHGLISLACLQKASHPKPHSQPTKNSIILLDLLIIDNIMYILLPLAASSQNSDIFIPIATAIILIRLVIVFKVRKKIPKFEFALHFIDKMLWFCFNFIYLFYWLVDKLAKPTGQIWSYVLEFFDMAEYVIFIGSCLTQLIMILLTLLVGIGRNIHHRFCKSPKIQDENQLKQSNNVQITQFPKEHYQKQKDRDQKLESDHHQFGSKCPTTRVENSKRKNVIHFSNLYVESIESNQSENHNNNKENKKNIKFKQNKNSKSNENDNDNDSNSIYSNTTKMYKQEKKETTKMPIRNKKKKLAKNKTQFQTVENEQIQSQPDTLLKTSSRKHKTQNPNQPKDNKTETQLIQHKTQYNIFQQNDEQGLIEHLQNPDSQNSNVGNANGEETSEEHYHYKQKDQQYKQDKKSILNPNGLVRRQVKQKFKTILDYKFQQQMAKDNALKVVQVNATSNFASQRETDSDESESHEG